MLTELLHLPARYHRIISVLQSDYSTNDSYDFLIHPVSGVLHEIMCLTNVYYIFVTCFKLCCLWIHPVAFCLNCSAFLLIFSYSQMEAKAKHEPVNLIMNKIFIEKLSEERAKVHTPAVKNIGPIRRPLLSGNTLGSAGVNSTLRLGCSLEEFPRPVHLPPVKKIWRRFADFAGKKSRLLTI